jgi:GTP cyclohydrolase I
MTLKGKVIQDNLIREAVASILMAIGEDPEREGLRDTPKRVAEMYAEIFSGIGSDPQEAIDAIFDAGHSDPVVLRDVPFHSICEHHMLPFFGKAQLGYVPNGKIAGLSKLARTLDLASRRLQVQERLTGQVADSIFSALSPRGVVVELEAEHLCMSMRGVENPGSRVVTTAVRGKFDGAPLDAQGLLAIMRRN